MFQIKLFKPTVADLINALKQLPEDYRVLLNPSEQEDVTDACTVQVLEGGTSDGPGTAWIKLEEGSL